MRLTILQVSQLCFFECAVGDKQNCIIPAHGVKETRIGFTGRGPCSFKEDSILLIPCVCASGSEYKSTLCLFRQKEVFLLSVLCKIVQSKLTVYAIQQVFQALYEGRHVADLFSVWQRHSKEY